MGAAPALSFRLLFDLALIGLVPSVSISVVEMTSNLSPLPPRLLSPYAAAAMYGSLAAFVLAYYAALCVLVLLPLVWCCRVQIISGAISLAVFTACAFVGVLDYEAYYGSSLRSIVSLSTSIVVTVLAYSVTTWLRGRFNLGPFLRRLAPLGASLLLVVSIFVWMQHYHWRNIARSEQWLASAGYTTIVLCLLAPLFLNRASRGPSRVASLILVVLGLWPVVSMLHGIPTNGLPSSDPHLAGVKQIVLISIDTLRPAELSAYSGADRKTPNIDSLAGDSVLFRSAYSPAPWTLPSMTSVMNGVSPYYHGAGLEQAAHFPTFVEYLSRAGYYTKAIVGNHVLASSGNVARGFTDYEVYCSEPLGESFLGIRLMKAFPDRFVTGANTETLTRRAIEWLDQNHERPFFLWLHYFDPHWPYAPPLQYLGSQTGPASIGTRFETANQVMRGMRLSPRERRWTKALYDAEVRLIDHHVGRVLDRLRQLGRYEETVIVLTSDHGEEFWEHERFGHGHTVYNELLHVPLIIKSAGSSARREIASSVSIQALAPTILDLAGVDFADPDPWLPSLEPLCRQEPPGTYIFEPFVSTGSHQFEDQEAVFFGNWKFIRKLHSGREELYELTEDFAESTSILDGHPHVAQQGREILNAHRENAQAARTSMGLAGVGPYKPDAQTLRTLKTLGYVQ